MNNVFPLLFVLATTLLLSGCDDNDPQNGRIEFSFLHEVNNEPVVLNQMRYTNAAENLYEVTEIQWFISDVAVVTKTGAEISLKRDGFSHYIDTNLPETALWKPSDRIPAGKYSQIKFTFGLKGDKNVPGLFPDLPESNMVWPFAMGGEKGGYHYMKLNGFWMNTAAQRMPFNFHLGVGQIYDSEDKVVEFVQNWFEVILPVDLEVRADQVTRLELAMNIESWFDSPIIYDHNQFGSMIMKNQEAMGIIAQNGKDAFDVKVQNSF
jgi:hypothetical protein